MSLVALGWVMKMKPRQIGITPAEKDVLIHMCDCHNAETGRCFPSHKYLIEHTGFVKSTVGEALKSLEEKQFFVSDPGGRGRSTRYILNFKKAPRPPGYSENEGSADHTDQDLPSSENELPRPPGYSKKHPDSDAKAPRPPGSSTPTTGVEPGSNHINRGRNKNSFSEPEARPLLDTTNLSDDPVAEIAGLKKTIGMLPTKSPMANALQRQVDKLESELAEETS